MEKITAGLLLVILKPGTVSASGSVTFENPNPCAVKGSSVDFSCSYNYSDGEIVEKTAWYKGILKDDMWTRVELSELPIYHNRTKYLGDLQHDCSLVIHDLQHNDSGYYYFRFDTNKYGWRSTTSVHLTVTEVSARVHPEQVRAGDIVTLECTTTCQLSSTLWFKDGLPVAKPEFQAQAEDAGNYLCAVKGHKSLHSDPITLDVLYPPLNMSIEVSHPGSLAVGSSVNLTCSSAANPAADNYTWYRSGSSSSSWLPVGSGEVLSLLSVEESHTGLYLCQVRNSMGENNATQMLLAVDETHINSFILLVGTGVLIVALLPLVIIGAWRNRRRSAANKEEHSHDYENITINK